MKRKLLFILVLICTVTFTYSQDYSTGIGLRGGLSQGLTVKHFLSEKTAAEGLLQTRWGGFSVTALYEIHSQNVFDVDRLNFYYGAGGHVGLWEGNSSWGTVGTQYIIIGIDGVLGLEYNLEAIPLNFSIDWKPEFNIVGYRAFWPDGGALSVRYIF